MNTEPKRLFATISPDQQIPSFSIPLFGNASTAYVQEIGADGSITDFKEVTLPEAFHPAKTQQERNVGDPALMAFSFGNGDVAVAPRASLAELLRSRLKEYQNRPFLLLDVASFLEDGELLKNAVDAAYNELKKINPAAATSWLSQFLDQELSAGNSATAIADSKKTRQKTIASVEWAFAQTVQRVSDFYRHVGQDDEREKVIAESSQMKLLLAQAELVAKTTANVLIQGEAGSGKTYVAHLIHRLASGKNKPFFLETCERQVDFVELIASFCQRLASLEKERTPNKSRTIGGTLFLSEIGDLNLKSQETLIRALESSTFKSFQKIGLRIIAATRHDLLQKIKEGQFRTDLFYRVNVVSLSVPSLRERKEDLVPLVQHFLRLQAEQFQTAPKVPTPELLRVFLSYSWPENVLELERLIEALTREVSSESITLEHLRVIRNQQFHTWEHNPKEEVWLSSKIEEFEREVIVKALQTSRLNHAKAALLLGISRRTLRQKIDKLNVSNLISLKMSR